MRLMVVVGDTSRVDGYSVGWAVSGNGVIHQKGTGMLLSILSIKRQTEPTKRLHRLKCGKYIR